MSDVYRISIDYPDVRLVENRALQNAMCHRTYRGRVPVWLGIYARYVLDQRGASYREYWKSPRDHLIHQLENFKWIVENVDDDRWSNDEILVVPDFENIPNSAAMGCQVGWSDTQPPHALPCIEKPEEMMKVDPPRPTQGFWGMMLRWRAEMNHLLDTGRIVVTRNGRPIRVHVTMGAYSLGPFSVATDMVGPKFYEWLLLYPRECHHLLQTITTALIDMELYCRRMDISRSGGFNLAEDAAQLVSAAMFDEFCLPYAHKLYAAFPGERIMHMCGHSQHLHETLVNKLKITYFSGFGSVVRPDEIAKTMSGRVLLRGNVDCLLLMEGAPCYVKEAARRCLETLAPAGGYVLSDGFNVAPGTPVGNLWALKEEAIAYKLPVADSTLRH